MKKFLFSLFFVGGVAYGVSAQEAFVQVLYPSDIVASYENSFADWALTPDMTVSTNRVIAPVKLANDGSAAPTQLCNAAPANFFAGHIALIERGACEFGKKAFNAWTAGAVGVIIMNNAPGEMINMAAGADGDQVTVPAVFIKKEDGMNILTKLQNSDSVSVLLGNKNGYYGNDLGSIPGYTANVPAQTPVQMAANTTDFPIVYAAQVYNYGSNEATHVRVKAELFKNGTSIHTSTSDTLATFAAGDSTDAFTFTNYTGDLGVGEYKITYTIESDSTDASASDNYFEYPFKINDDKIFAYAKYNADSSFTFNSGNYGPSDRTGAFKSCINFVNNTDNQLGVLGVYFNASMQNDPVSGDPQSIEGQEILVSVQKWADMFAYGTDTPTFDALTDITGGNYIYETDAQSQFVYADMDSYVLLEKDASYLVCLTAYDENIFIGYDNETKYDFYNSIAQRYISPIADGATWYAAGFNGGPVPSLTLRLFTPSEVGLATQDKLVEATVYPNPAKDFLNVSVSNYNGNADLTITDIAGKTVLSQAMSLVNGNAVVNTANLTSGMYIVKMQLADGSQVKKNVVIE